MKAQACENGFMSSSPRPGMSARARSIATGEAWHDPVTIVGAGPAGLACAIALARGGRRVVVREWHNHVGHRFHGDFQGLENWSDERDVLDELGACGIEPTFAHHPVHEGTAFDAKGRTHHLKSRRPLYYLVSRGRGMDSLDEGLLRQARDVGVEVRFSDRVREMAGPSILATGPHTADVIAVGYVFDTGMSDGHWLAVNDRLAPLGYAYLLVHRGRGTVASCMFTGFKDQEQYRERTISFFSERAGLLMRNPRRFGGFGSFRLPRAAMQGGNPVIGEQAGFQDALAGFGLRFGVRSGLLAARSVLEGMDYVALWRSELMPLLRVGIVNRFLFNTLGESGRALALRKLSAADAGVTLGKFHRPSLPSRLVAPVALLRYRAPLRDRSCDHVDCQCVWCHCQGEPGGGGFGP